jgi:hypothetical protein
VTSTTKASGQAVVREAADLLDVLNPGNEEFDIVPALTAFVAYLQELASKHAKQWLGDYVAQVCFRKEIDFSSDTEFTQFARVSLVLAANQLATILKGLVDKPAGSPLLRLREVLRDYVFDLKRYVEWLERRHHITLFAGGKNYRIESFQLFMLARQLGHGSGDLGDHKTSQAACIFALRQALEARFFRAIGVDLLDQYGQTPKTRHGLQMDFIAGNPQFFELTGCSLAQIQHVYKWSNDIVHGAYQPLAWQVAHALEVSAPIFGAGPHRGGKGFSAHGAIQIKQIDEMRQAFLAYFASEYHHRIWCATFFDPDAGTI